jgi:hypothetical protein
MTFEEWWKANEENLVPANDFGCTSEIYEAAKAAWEARDEKVAALHKVIDRACPLCENMHHEPHEYHKLGTPCPVMKWVDEIRGKTDDL